MGRKQASHVATLRSGTNTEHRRGKQDAYADNKRKKEICAYEEHDEMADKGYTRIIYERMRHFIEDFKTLANSCRTQSSDLATDAQSILNLWRKHFASLLNGSENAATGNG